MLMALLLMAIWAQDDGPLAPAARGEWQCYTPDVARKTCRVMAKYGRQADGSWLNTALVLIGPEQDMVLETVTPVRVVGDTVCGSLSRGYTLTGKIFVRGALQPDVVAIPILKLFADKQAAVGMLGPMICTRYVADGEVLRAEISWDGVHQPDHGSKVIWVRPDQGWRVGG